MKLSKKIIITLFFILLILPVSLYGKNELIIGVNTNYSLISSYYSFDTKEFSKKQSSAYGYGIGAFFDYNYTPYAGIRFNVTVFPTWNTDESVFNKEYNTMFSEMLTEFELLFTTLFDTSPFNLWLGLGPALQWITSDRLDNYIITLFLALGSNYSLTERVRVTTEVHFGINIALDNNQYEQFMDDATNTSDFLNKGFNVSTKLGAGYAF
ncbi:MAG: hypothetical protein GY754_26790 [bacterium]|nr:hypothetical protein [bacterium]